MRYLQDEWLTALTERFGDSPRDWAFQCPQCGDVATGADFKAALAEHPVTRKDGTTVAASDRLARECIGRTLGALSEKTQAAWNKRRKTGEVRGCDWTAYGLFRGPDVVVCPDDASGTRDMYAFAMAPAVTTVEATK